jgi:hypothetical protein
MRKIALTILGALLIVGSAARIASAAEGHVRADSSNYRGAHNWSKQRIFRAPQARARPNVDSNIEELQKEQDLQWGCGWPLCASAGGG